MAEKLFSESDREQIISAIQAAELRTSGEIQVHIENYCKGDLMDRAAEVFAMLKMYQTKERNGVLFYLAVRDHKFAILGDGGDQSSGGTGFLGENQRSHEGKISARSIHRWPSAGHSVCGY